ncbi:MAG: hypothetical protein J6V43_01770 [Rikenellaceae bacterium]|nr:hypothetical protein [Rikenellaceae bacterium]
MERKFTTPFVIAGLAVAFAAVSAWVWLSGGKNARAVRTKFKIGGLLLTLTTAVATQSCTNTSCYDPAPAPYCDLYDEDMKFANGDTLRIYTLYYDYKYYSFNIVDKENNVLQEEKLSRPYQLRENPAIVAVGNYVGEAKVNVYGGDDENAVAQENHIKSFDITIEAVATLPEDTTETEENTDNVE